MITLLITAWGTLHLWKPITALSAAKSSQHHMVLRYMYGDLTVGPDHLYVTFVESHLAMQ